MRAFATLDDADIKNKRVLVRVDLNVPVVGGKVTDRTRIERIAPTIIELVDKGGKVILLSHFGRPSGHDPKQSLKLLAPAIADVLKRRPKISMSFLRWAALLITALKPEHRKNTDTLTNMRAFANVNEPDRPIVPPSQ